MLWPWHKRRSISDWLGIAYQSGHYAAVCLKKGETDDYFPSASDTDDSRIGLERWLVERKLAGVPTTWVLGREDYQLHLAEAPAVDDSELADALKYRLGEQQGISPETQCVQAFRLPPQAYHGRMPMAYAVAAEKSGLKRLVQWSQHHQLDLRQISIREMALLTVLEALEPETSVAVLEFEAERGSLSLFHEGALYLHRELKVGLTELTRALETLADIESDAVVEGGLDHSDLDHDGFDKSGPSWGRSLSLEGDSDQNAVIETLSLEIQRSLDYFDSQLGLGVIGQIWIPERSDLNMEALMRALETRIAPPVRPLSCRFLLNQPVSSQAHPKAKRQQQSASGKMKSDLLCMAWAGAVAGRDGQKLEEHP